MTKQTEELGKLADEMYNVNRHISWNYIAMKNEPTEKWVGDINRFIGEWIKKIREISEDLEEGK